ncbi:MAG: hypothetical protein GU361_02750 [Desulfurococcales archaeon]|nr:hypothetical protein [Desulfurococcales archaeon]
MDTEELRIDNCSGNPDNIARIVNDVRGKVAMGAKKIIVRIPEESFVECLDILRTISTEFIYLSIEVYEDGS